MRFPSALLFLAISITAAACGTEADVDQGESVDTAAVTTYRCGDVNNSGAITVTDAVMASSYANHTASPTDAQRWAADVDGNGTVSAADANQISRAAAGLSASLHCAMFGPLQK